MRTALDPVDKLALIFVEKNDAYEKAYRDVFEDDEILPPKDIAEKITGMFGEKWQFDFLPYELDKVEDNERKGLLLLRLISAAYADEMEDVQENIGSRIRTSMTFLQEFAPDMDFLNEVGPDSYCRRPLSRLWQMEPISIFVDMSVSEDAEADALLDTLESNFTPVVPDVASTADRIRREWFSGIRVLDEEDEPIFYDIIERSVIHAVASESRLAASDWIFRNFDSNALIIGVLELCRHGLECLGTFCGNYKFISEHRIFLESLLEGKD
jgi:hypothetical protein